MKRAFPNRHGVLLYVVLFAILLCSLLSIQFFQFSRQAQHSLYHLGIAEIARQMVESACDEALAKLGEGCRRPVFSGQAVEAGLPGENLGFNPAAWLLHQNPGKREIPISETSGIFAESLGSQYSAEIKVYGNLFDRRADAFKKGTDFYRYSPHEGNGTFEIQGEVMLKRRGSPFLSCKLLRHYDYRVLSLVSQRDNTTKRSRYAGNYPLDYVLLITEVPPLPAANLLSSFRIAQPREVEKSGKIFIAGSERSGNPLSLNFPQSFERFFGKSLEGWYPNRPGVPQPANSPAASLLPDFFLHKAEGVERVPEGYYQKSVPFRHRMLFSRKVFGERTSNGQYDATQGLIQTGLYSMEPPSLNLSGIVSCEAGAFPTLVELGDGRNDIAFSGGGVLIADTIILKSGIRRTAQQQDLCLLYANRIIVETGAQIEAALLAFKGDGIFAPSAPSGLVEFRRPGKILGCLGADTIRVNPGEQVSLEYDPLMKAARPEEELYQVDISRILTFERFSGKSHVGEEAAAAIPGNSFQQAGQP